MSFSKNSSIFKALINFGIIAVLSIIAFSWVFWVFHKDFLLMPVLSVIVLRILMSLLFFNDYSSSWSKASAKAFLIKTLINGVAFVVYVPIFYGEVRIAIFVSELFIYLFLINFSMYIYQYLKSYAKSKGSLLIYGAGQAGVQIAKELDKHRYQLKAFIDDDDKLQGRSIDGVKILSAVRASKIFNKNMLDLLVIAIPSADTKAINDAYNFCADMAKNVKVLPSLGDILQDKPYSNQLKDIDIKDLLARHPTDLDKQLISEFISDKAVLITGAGGSIGGELAQQCLHFGAQQLILVDNSEFNLYSIEQQLNSKKALPILLSVLDKDNLAQIFNQHKIDIVIHAAAYKHVSMVEANVSQAIINNVFGTKTIIDICIAKGIEKVVLISTDKAVRPTSVMGATKRICELYAQNVKADKTKIIAVRFGNVLGSSGSVIPLFEQQIRTGGPITVTHPEVSRYFMLIDEAAQLVLQAAVLGKGGEVFILDMGQPVKIFSLAQQMLKLSGVSDVDIKFIGLRRGEKLCEELLISDSGKKTVYDSITVAKKDKCAIDKLVTDMENLLTMNDKLNALKQIIPEFNHQLNL